jgi:hypothetical protein
VGTAAVLAEKLLINGIEVHQAAQTLEANGTAYKPGSWVILMDQPFAALVKDLLEPQRYPDLRVNPNAPPELPYDVTAWTLPMQMGIEVAAISQPLSDTVRGGLRKLERIEAPPGRIDGSGPVFTFSHAPNGAIRATNEILAAGGVVSFAKSDGAVLVSNFDRGRLEPIVRKHGLTATSMKEAPASYAIKKPRVGVFQPWAGVIDEGWTRWLLEQFGFAYTSLRIPDVQAGRLRDRFDTIVFAEMSANAITEGWRAGTVPGQYAGGIGESGIEKLREFVNEGGTLVTFSGAANFAIEKLGLPVTNMLSGVRPEEFFCSGCLLRAEIRDAAHPVNFGLPAEPIVMFERSPAFETKSGFRGKILASYPRERNPLMSGYLLRPERIQGKAAALDVALGKGRVILIGFRPQWRGQSHGTYKFFFNALYYNAGMTPDAAPGGTPPSSTASNPQQSAWRAAAEAAKNELPKLLDQNKAYQTARGSRAAEEGKKLEATLDQFLRDRIPALDDLRNAVEDQATARKFSEYSANLKRFIADVRAKDFSAQRPADVIEQYKLSQIP